MYDVTRGLRKNGFFLLNTIFDGEELVRFITQNTGDMRGPQVTVYAIKIMHGLRGARERKANMDVANRHDKDAQKRSEYKK